MTYSDAGYRGTAPAVRCVTLTYRAACAAPLPRRRALRHHQCRGLSLLEVILALTILALSMAAIGELIRIGSHSARNAQDLTLAQILCESKLSEIVAGITPYDPVTREPMVMDPDWYYTVQLAPTEEQGVMALAVTVETHIERRRPVAYTLVRWVPDPGIEIPDAPEEVSDTTSDSSSEDNNSEQDEGDSQGFGN